MTKTPIRKVRCAIYTRKSSEEGLDMEFNSLDAQREACEAYVASQKREGWLLVPDHYDDGGFSGGTLERPALKRLLVDIEAGCIDCVVVYKIDRLSRALVDFTKLVEVFDRHSVTFVSITQSFNTTTSMGRLTLNILLSFAQFEREVIGERIRDKFAASRKKGMWMGGTPPLGYDVKDRKLVVNEEEAALVRHIFERFIKVGSATLLVKELNADGHRTKSWTTQSGRVREGRPFNKGAIYKILNNRVYIGEAVHKGKGYPGEHQAIIPMLLWDKVHAVLAENTRSRANRTRAHRCKRMLENGEHNSIADLAEMEKFNKSYLSRILRLTLLAPDIVQAILDGRQPKGLALADLMEPFPVEWERQKERWGSLGKRPDKRCRTSLVAPGVLNALPDISSVGRSL